MKRIFALFLSFAVLFSCLVLPAGAMFDPTPVYQVQAQSAYIVNTDTTPLKKQYEEMHKIGVNINQIAKKVNSTGDLYPEEMQELKEMVKELWHILRSSPLK